MSSFLLYGLSKDKELFSFLSIMLSKMNVKLEQFEDSESLFSLCEEKVPNILLLDDSTFEKSELLEVLKEYLVYYKRNVTNILFITDKKDIKGCVDYLLNGVDYFFEKPVNPMEIVARVNAALQFQDRIKLLMSYQRNMAMAETMEGISDYLTNHVRGPIQKFIDSRIDDADKKTLVKHVQLVRNGAAKIMAALNAVRDEVNKLIACHGSAETPEQALDDLYKKNLSIINAAYELNTENESKEESVEK